MTYSSTQPTPGSRMSVRRTRGVLSGGLLVLLGAWGALIPFIGPEFDYAYGPDTSWHFTWGRFWMEILPGAAVVLGGLILLMSANRAMLLFGAWLAALAGMWFVVGQPLSLLWRDGGPWAGQPYGPTVDRAVLQQIGFFTGLGVVIVFFAAIALGRMTIIGARDLVGSGADGQADDAQPAPVVYERRVETTDSSDRPTQRVYGEESEGEIQPRRTDDSGGSTPI